MTRHDVTRRAVLRYTAFLRAELEVLPASHSLYPAYEAQLRELEHRQPPGPRRVVGAQR